MKTISIIGVGMSRDTVTQEGLRAIGEARVLLGAKRLIEPYIKPGIPAFTEYAPEQAAKIISQTEASSIAVLVSGDAGFYSAADKLVNALSAYDVRTIPGISSLSFLFARLGRPWQDAALLSCHGREANLVDTVRRNRITFALTGKNIGKLCGQLINAGFGELTATVGENLGMENERILTLSAAEMQKVEIGSLAALLLENPAYDDRVRSGIPDEEFLRGKVPMTKAEVRALTLAKLALRPDSVCCDVGAGTGSVTVEMALAAYRGRVYAIDRNEEAIDLIEANRKAFHIGNIVSIAGTAPEALAGLPKLDAAFIGGSSGNMCGIITALLSNNPEIHIVVNAVSLESTLEALKAFSENGIEPDIVQLAAARAKPVAGLHMMTSQNPVFIISGNGSGQNV